MSLDKLKVAQALQAVRLDDVTAAEAANCVLTAHNEASAAASVRVIETLVRQAVITELLKQ